MNKSKFIFILFLLPLFAFTAHKFYISLVKIEYKAEKETVQITMRIFINDLQKALNETNNTSLELGVSDEYTKSNTLINKYINDNFLVKINSKTKTYKYLGKEYENDVVYLYLELQNVKTINNIEVTDTMLMDYFPTQKNIVKLNINNTKKTFLLIKEKSKDNLSF